MLFREAIIMNQSYINHLIISFLQLKGWGNQSVKKFFNETRVYNSVSELTLAEIKDLPDKISDKKLCNLISKIENEHWNEARKKASEIIKSSKRNDIEILNFLSPGYPLNLKMINDSPAIIYVKGNSELLDSNLYSSLATIGTRKPLKNVEKITDRLIEILVENNFITVSGLAIGTDSICHLSTLNNDGKTIAVLSNGLDTVYPKRNQKLANEILEKGGTLISTNPIGTKVTPANLVERDKWQAGLSDGVIAMQTSSNGGTTHAMNASLEYKRPLAVLGLNAPINSNKYPQISGNIKYIKQKKALSLVNQESIDKFIKFVKDNKKKRNNEYEKRLKSQNHDSFKQIGLFE